MLDIVVLALCAVISGAEGCDDIEDWGGERDAWLRRYLGQRTCEEKSNEITAIEKLLPAPELKDAVVTIDAMGCRTAIAARITAGGGDYVLAVKDNQPHLAEALRDFFATLNAPGHCRRQVLLLLHAVRAHWGIENGLHWCLDVTFGEDASLIRLRNAAQNFSFLRRLGLNLFRADKSRAISLPGKLKAAACNPAHLATALHLREICCSSLVAPAGNDPSQAASVVCLQTWARCAPLAVFARALADGVLTARKNDDQTDCGLHGWHLE